MTRTLATAAAALLLASCYDPGGKCAADADCLSGQICGADGLCAAGTRPPPGNPPVATADAYTFSYATSGQGPFQVSVVKGVLANDTAGGGGTLAAEMVPSGTTTTSAGGTVYLAPDGSFIYATPVVGYTGADGFTYRATDGVLSSADTAVSITVSP